MLLGLGLLAERIDPRFGSVGACAGAVAGVVLTGLVLVHVGRQHAGVELRPLLLIESMPLLALPAVVMRIPGTHTRASDWVIALALYATSRLLELVDAPIFSATGWISGHTLMHLGCAAVVGWMAYRAAVTRSTGSIAADAGRAFSQRHTSLNTTG